MDMANSITQETEMASYSPNIATETYPAEIFGKLPDGFMLEKQNIRMLMYWYRKAITAVDQLPADVSEDELDASCDILWRLYTAILAAKVHGASGVALKLQAIVMKLDSEKNDCIEEVLDVNDILRLAAELSYVTKPTAPVKKVGAFHRGNKLTRTGLLHRYQSFLMKELKTLSLNLYGNSDCALEYLAEDDAVNLRCRGQKHPFFNESKLTDRARSVLKSLKVDTKKFDIWEQSAA